MAPLSSPPARTAAARARWIILALACLTSFLTYVHRYSWGAARPYFKQEYGISNEQMGWLDAAFSLTYALGQYPGGWAGDVLGPRLVIPLAALLWTVMMVTPTLRGDFWSLLGGRLAFGAAQAPCYPNLGKITKSWFPLGIRTTVQGLVASFSGRAGGAAAPLLIGALLMGGLKLSWQQSLWALAATGFLFAALFWMLFRNSPAEHPWSNEAEAELVTREEAAEKPEIERIRWTPANLLNLAFFMGASFASTFADNLFVFYMPQFLVEEKAFTPAQMGFFAGLPILGGAIGGMCGGILNDVLIRRLGNRRLARSLVAAGGKVLAAALIAASVLVADGRQVMLILLACKFFSDWSQPTWWGTVTDIGGPVAGRVFGMVNMIGSIGGFIAGPAMGYVLGRYGWTALFTFVGAMYVLTALFWCLVNCEKRLVDK